MNIALRVSQIIISDRNMKIELKDSSQTTIMHYKIFNKNIFLYGYYVEMRKCSFPKDMHTDYQWIIIYRAYFQGSQDFVHAMP